MEATKGFIIQTAKDYDLPEERVEQIWKISKDATEFYEKLEEDINARSRA